MHKEFEEASIVYVAILDKVTSRRLNELPESRLPKVVMPNFIVDQLIRFKFTNPVIGTINIETRRYLEFIT